jgi:hypothetical protein
MANTSSSIKAAVKRAFGALTGALWGGQRHSRVQILAPQASDDELREIRRRAAFYFPAAAADIRVARQLSWSAVCSPAPLLLYGITLDDLPGWAKLHGGIFNVDQVRNPMDGWSWCEAGTYVYGIQDQDKAQGRLLQHLNKVKQLGFDRCYVFGTGPSLERARHRDWQDGARVVCNTIVRDAELWHHIAPHVVVAGDAIYHFGFTEFACAFRKDLHARLSESPDVLFAYPDYFDFLIRREFSAFADRLVPIPNGDKPRVHDDFAVNFSLPPLGNVLNKLLLPMGCNLSKHVGLWGFDGRAPKDQLFWSNSQKQSYTELLPTLQAAHPAFFDHFVPRENPEQYVQSVHGDVLEFLLSQAEAEGWTFSMLHHTWTPTLAKRMDAGAREESQALLAQIEQANTRAS